MSASPRARGGGEDGGNLKETRKPGNPRFGKAFPENASFAMTFCGKNNLYTVCHYGSIVMDVDDVVLENSSPQAENFHDFGCELFFCKSNQTRNSPPQAD